VQKLINLFDKMILKVHDLRRNHDPERNGEGIANRSDLRHNSW